MLVFAGSAHADPMRRGVEAAHDVRQQTDAKKTPRLVVPSPLVAAQASGVSLVGRHVAEWRVVSTGHIGGIEIGMSATEAVVMLALVGLFSACSSVPARDEPQHRVTGGTDTGVVRHGTVTAIDVIAMAARTPGAGTLRDAIVRAPALAQAGNGLGRPAAPGLGDGTKNESAGDAVEQRSKDDSEVYRVTVRLDDGRIGMFDYRRIDDLRVGHRVRIEGGQLHRV